MNFLLRLAAVWTSVAMLASVNFSYADDLENLITTRQHVLNQFNGIAAEKALKLATLALLEDGTDKKVSLDEVIQTMLQTGRDMKATYKETSLAGLAITLQKKAIPVSVRVVEC